MTTFAFPAFFGGGSIGPLEIGIIALVVLLFFGNRVPQIMRSLGRGLTQFRKGLREVEEEIKSLPGDGPSPGASSPGGRVASASDAGEGRAGAGEDPVGATTSSGRRGDEAPSPASESDEKEPAG